MTAEVAVLNGGAVALAADSAVTIGGQKIYNSALKLWSLSKVAPVGVMVYGNAALMDVPWEVLIKEHRSNLGHQRFGTLKQYCDHFVEYLNDAPDVFDQTAQTEWLDGNVGAYYTLIQTEFFERVHPRLEEDGQITSETLKRIFSDVVKEHHQRVLSYSFADGLNQTFENRIRKKYLTCFRKIRKRVFENISINSAVAAKLYDIAAALHSRAVFSTGVSGIVIAGYGDKEIYPSLHAFEIEGVIENRLKFKHNPEKSYAISSGRDGSVIAFAQDDMVASFMNGINANVLITMQSYLSRIFSRLPELLSAGEDRDRKEIFKRDAQKLLRAFYQDLNEHLSEQHIQPVLRMVTALPKDELAEMAESLVNLTAFKRRMTDSVETVGGPIDVAVISKGDGLIWVKRKHYFQPELNRHFFDNYFREVEGV